MANRQTRPEPIVRLRERSPKAGPAAYAGTMVLLVLGLCGLGGLVIGQPLLFPSLAPTVMLFVESPHAPTSAPRSVILGHLVGIAAGFGMLHLFGLADNPPMTQEGLTGVRVVAASLSVALTAVVLSLLKAQHPPGGTTALLFSLGLFTSPTEIAVVVGGVLLLVVIGVAVNRLLGVRQSLWGPESEAHA
ncbi:HPP family protein [Pseudokineococcus sp. 1T1Z-3]|uniref:HPP family protein n=1 Tax=Pseudokineococcus sp. 1T1Z-3 TaxID=3132745 RepID=UPI0030A4E46A